MKLNETDHEERIRSLEKVIQKLTAVFATEIHDLVKFYESDVDSDDLTEAIMANQRVRGLGALASLASEMTTQEFLDIVENTPGLGNGGENE